MTNAFSIDLEDYFHTAVAASKVARHQWDTLPPRIPVTVPRLLDLLDSHRVSSTVFVLGWVARKYPALVREIASRGHEIACHSDLHRHVFSLSLEEFREDTRAAKQSIEDAAGCAVQGYRAPSFSITPGTEWAFDVLSDLGFRYDSSVNPVHHKTYGNPHAPRTPYRTAQHRLLEIPVATWRVGSRNLPVSGGAYLRLLPLRYLRTGLRSINRREKQPFTLYIHPWELDSSQPSLGLGWKSHIRQTWGARSVERKMAALFKAFRFAPIRSVYAHLLA